MTHLGPVVHTGEQVLFCQRMLIVITNSIVLHSPVAANNLATQEIRT